MPPLDFPNSPSLNQLYAGPNNVQWQWDGQKWLGTPNTLGPIIVAASPPTFQAGQLWWDSTGGNLYLAYDDGNTQQWVPASNIAGLANAATTMDVDKALNDVGRNLIHNSAFTVWQRGNGPFSITASGGYTADRWTFANAGGFDTVSVTRGTLPDSERATIGDEAARFCVATTFTGTGANAAAATYVDHRIEGVHRLAGKTVIVSFWAFSSPALKFGLNAYQIFGTGGSPSGAALVAATGTATQLTTNWVRYSVPITLPSVAGKTLGTNGDDATWLRFYYSAGTTNNPWSGNIGVQSGAINIWGVQLEIVQPGQTVPSKLEKRDPVLELQQCQRFYQTGQLMMSSVATAAAQGFVTSSLCPVTMRSNSAVMTMTTNACTNATVPVLAHNGVSFNAQANSSAAGGVTVNVLFTASADL